MKRLKHIVKLFYGGTLDDDEDYFLCTGCKICYSDFYYFDYLGKFELDSWSDN